MQESTEAEFFVPKKYVRSTFKKGYIRMEQRPQTNRPGRSQPNGAGLAIGIAIGVAVGAALHNIGLGIAIGVAVGVVFESTNARRNRD